MSNTDCRIPEKPGDPAEKGVAPSTVHRAGYHPYERLFRWAKAGHCLAAGEGAVLAAKIEELETQLEAAQSLIDCLQKPQPFLCKHGIDWVRCSDPDCDIVA